MPVVRYPWLAVLLVALPAGASLASQSVADSLGRTLGREAAAVISRMPRSPRPVPAPSSPVASPLEVEAIASAPVSVSERKSLKRASKGKKAQAQAPQGVFVSARTVLALAARGVAPKGVPVPAAGERPAGLRMVGVSALGVGLRDGDVLTRVSGGPATSFGAVVEAVIRARAQSARIISGEFWRDGRQHALAVEQPYVSAADPAGVAAPAP